MSESGLSTNRPLTDLVLQMLQNKIAFFLNSKRNPMQLWNKSTKVTMRMVSSPHRHQ